MSNSKAPRLASADRWGDSLIVIFDDGQGGVYSSEMLYSLLSQAGPLADATEARNAAEQPKSSADNTDENS